LATLREALRNRRSWCACTGVARHAQHIRDAIARAEEAEATEEELMQEGRGGHTDLDLKLALIILLATQIV
jgi:hypothetical protein